MDVHIKIIDSFEKEDWEVRVLFATIAFGLGINVHGLYNVILVGHPTEFDDLHVGQLMSGRAGRDAFMKGDEWSSITIFHQEATLS